MSVIDDILSSKQQNYPSAMPQPTMATQPIVQPSQPQQQQTAARTSVPHMSYVDMIQQMSTYTPPTREELEKERKKQRRDELFAKIGNGLTAFHEAYSNARGVKPITPHVNLTDKVRERYEKIQKERDGRANEYLNAYIRAMQADDAAARDDRNWRRQLERDAAADDKDRRDFDFRQAQADWDRDKWQQTFDRQSEQWKEEFEQRERQYGRQNALAWAAQNLREQTQRDNKELRQQAIAAQGARGVRGKTLAFSDGKENQVNIYENVWRGSMQKVYDTIVADFEAQRAANSNADVPRTRNLKTAQQKEDFVKQHWYKSTAGRQLMQALAGIDPATMTSTTRGDGLGWGSDNDDNGTDW